MSRIIRHAAKIKPTYSASGYFPRSSIRHVHECQSQRRKLTPLPVGHMLRCTGSKAANRSSRAHAQTVFPAYPLRIVRISDLQSTSHDRISELLKTSMIGLLRHPPREAELRSCTEPSWHCALITGYLPSWRTYARTSSIWESLSFPLKAGILFLPFVMMPFKSSSDCFCTSGE